jgi:hypothetical protein
MPDLDRPALNDDGTLKDASELSFVHSPSDESRSIALANRGKRKRSETSDSEDDILPGLKNKVPARKISGKRVPKLSGKAVAGAAFCSPKSRKFFQSQFTRASHFYLSFHLTNLVILFMQLARNVQATVLVPRLP